MPSASSRRDEVGASAVEYGLIVFAIAAVITLVVLALGNVVRASFTNSCSDIAAKAAPSTTCAS